MTSLKINVPNPCSQTWNEMLPTQNGRFCSDCTKEVIDFTKFSDEQLKDWFDKMATEQVCGSFRPSQLTTFHQAFVKRSYWHSFSKSILVSSFLTFFMNSKTNAESNLLQEQIVIQVNDRIGENFQHTSKKSVSDSLTIRGIVQAKDDHSPLSGVWVGIKNGTKGVVTNAKGEFSIAIPSAKKTELVFKYLGFETLTQKIDYNPQGPLKIMMESAYLLGEVLIVKPQQPIKKINSKPHTRAEIMNEPLIKHNSLSSAQPSLVKRFWLFLKNPFTKSQ